MNDGLEVLLNKYNNKKIKIKIKKNVEGDNLRETCVQTTLFFRFNIFPRIFHSCMIFHIKIEFERI